MPPSRMNRHLLTSERRVLELEAERDRLCAEHAAEKAKADHFHAEYWRLQHANAALWAVVDDALALAASGRYLVFTDDAVDDQRGRDTPDYQRLLAALPPRAEA